MQVYLVGGAIRDELLGLPVTDRDWVVVGSNSEKMLAAGFKSVGRDFPVFLHPQTKEEYALARQERKTGAGYHGFTFNTSSTVTLEEDLSRRDLTINAMARDGSGELIDPYNGKADLDNRVLRHVSAAFSEDPVRVLRVARFMARFSNQGFTVADDTLQLMRQMVESGEVNNLVAERVWQEMQGALSASTPRSFFDTLRECDALAVILPEVDKLAGVPQVKRWHPEIDCFVHTMLVLEQACLRKTNLAVRFAALCHDLGKATTPANVLPSHHGHEERGAVICEKLCQRLRVPKKQRELAVLSARFHTHCHRAKELNARTLVNTLSALDVKRRPERFADFLAVCEADSRGRLGLEHRDYPQAAYLAKAAEVYRAVDTTSIAENCNDKQSIADKLHNARLNAINHWLKQEKAP